jgi:predicted neutral ceramidase superfamily lipid hydrolase
MVSIHVAVAQHVFRDSIFLHDVPHLGSVYGVKSFSESINIKYRLLLYSMVCSIMIWSVLIWPMQDLLLRKPARSFHSRFSITLLILLNTIRFSTSLGTDSRVNPLQLLH